MNTGQPVADGLDYAPCQYPGSRLYFRGPAADLTRPFVAFLGGTETYGKFIETPFPALVARATGLQCANFGIVNASVDAPGSDPGLMAIARRAGVRVLQVTGAHMLSNRFYTVHPRRNDRFLRASTVLSALFPEVDFSEICFTGHLLARLWEVSPDRFQILREELQAAWSARMRSTLEQLGPATLLLWFAPQMPSDIPWEERPDPLHIEPAFVTRRMLDSLRPLVRMVLMATPSPRAMATGTAGMVYTSRQQAAARALLPPAAHEEAAATIARALREPAGGELALPAVLTMGQSLPVSSGTAVKRSATRP
ncbi:MAG: hypothetical protein H3C51_00025 [Rubellimicrobium sp.]|nr:hypothetical protein [Rubellimicrobium sp.]